MSPFREIEILGIKRWVSCIGGGQQIVARAFIAGTDYESYIRSCDDDGCAFASVDDCELSDGADEL